MFTDTRMNAFTVSFITSGSNTVGYVQFTFTKIVHELSFNESIQAQHWCLNRLAEDAVK